MADNLIKSMNIENIMKMIPHRYPMLMVDKVISVDDKQIHAVKNVTINEDFFNGHFPGHPIMPGVLIVEAMAQTAGLYITNGMTDEETKNKVVYFMSIEEAKFRRPVVPGDVLNLEVKKVQNRANVWKMKGVATVDGKKVADAVFSAMIVKKS